MFYFTSFVSEGFRKDETFGDIMIQAILMERIGFIELLLMNGFVMKTFLTVEKLAVLYNEQVLCIILLHRILYSFKSPSYRSFGNI